MSKHSTDTRRIHVLFVCLGNICRSPLAEAFFTRLIENQHLGESFFVDSAGTGNYHIGELPDPRARAVAKERGIILTHRARQVCREDFTRFDYIVAMDANNYQALVALRESLDRQYSGYQQANMTKNAEILLYRAFDSEAPNANVPDPYYDTIHEFRMVADIVERTGRSLLVHLRAQNDI